MIAIIKKDFGYLANIINVEDSIMINLPIQVSEITNLYLESLDGTKTKLKYEKSDNLTLKLDDINNDQLLYLYLKN